MTAAVLHGDCLEVLATLPAASVDAVVTDPPAGIAFMNKAWDRDKGGRDAWVAWMRDVAAECLRVAKPGAHALVWSLPRTSHWTATAWEDAGWDVRDRVSHLFGTGFPKSLDVGKAIDKAAGAEREVIGEKYSGIARRCREGGEIVGGTSVEALKWSPITAPATPEAAKWQGWGTALKPAVEDWWLLRKPLACPTVAAQVLATGTGALNIGACRVEAKGRPQIIPNHCPGFGDVGVSGGSIAAGTTDLGRFPANLAHDGSDEVLEAFAAFGERPGGGGVKTAGAEKRNVYGKGLLDRAKPPMGDTGTAARFFYSAKASKADRAGSKHPTVKPVALMRWLCRMVTPPGGVVLDPFAGSGTTGEAALLEGFRPVLIEREAEYHADILARLARHVSTAPLLAEAA